MYWTSITRKRNVLLHRLRYERSGITYPVIPSAPQFSKTGGGSWFNSAGWTFWRGRGLLFAVGKTRVSEAWLISSLWHLVLSWSNLITFIVVLLLLLGIARPWMALLSRTFRIYWAHYVAEINKKKNFDHYASLSISGESNQGPGGCGLDADKYYTIGLLIFYYIWQVETLRYMLHVADHKNVKDYQTHMKSKYTERSKFYATPPPLRKTWKLMPCHTF